MVKIVRQLNKSSEKKFVVNPSKGFCFPISLERFKGVYIGEKFSISLFQVSKFLLRLWTYIGHLYW